MLVDGGVCKTTDDCLMVTQTLGTSTTLFFQKNPLVDNLDLRPSPIERGLFNVKKSHSILHLIIISVWRLNQRSSTNKVLRNSTSINPTPTITETFYSSSLNPFNRWIRWSNNTNPAKPSCPSVNWRTWFTSGNFLKFISVNLHFYTWFLLLLPLAYTDEVHTSPCKRPAAATRAYTPQGNGLFQSTLAFMASVRTFWLWIFYSSSHEQILASTSNSMYVVYPSNFCFVFLVFFFSLLLLSFSRKSSLLVAKSSTKKKQKEKGRIKFGREIKVRSSEFPEISFLSTFQQQAKVSSTLALIALTEEIQTK